MRYKLLIIQGRGDSKSLYSGFGLVLARQGNDFVDAKELSGVGNRHHIAYRTTAAWQDLKNCIEIRDGVYTRGNKIDSTLFAFFIPENNQFFNADLMIDTLDSVILTPESGDVYTRVNDLVIKYIQSLNP